MRNARYRKVGLSKVTKAVKESNLGGLLPEAVPTTTTPPTRGERKVLDSQHLYELHILLKNIFDFFFQPKTDCIPTKCGH